MNSANEALALIGCRRAGAAAAPARLAACDLGIAEAGRPDARRIGSGGIPRARTTSSEPPRRLAACRDARQPGRFGRARERLESVRSSWPGACLRRRPPRAPSRSTPPNATHPRPRLRARAPLWRVRHSPLPRRSAMPRLAARALNTIGLARVQDGDEDGIGDLERSVELSAGRERIRRDRQRAEQSRIRPCRMSAGSPTVSRASRGAGLCERYGSTAAAALERRRGDRAISTRSATSKTCSRVRRRISHAPRARRPRSRAGHPRRAGADVPRPGPGDRGASRHGARAGAAPRRRSTTRRSRQESSRLRRAACARPDATRRRMRCWRRRSSGSAWPRELSLGPAAPPRRARPRR